MFEDWQSQMTEYIQKHIPRKPFAAIADTLDADIAELNRHYVQILLENGVIDANGDETGREYDEDDLIDAMLERFLGAHEGNDEHELLYATLIDAYLTLVEEASENR